MSKKVILAAVLAGLTSSALAGEKGLTVTVGGSLDTQYGIRSEKNDNKYVNGVNTKKRQTSALVNDTKLHVKVEGKAHGMSYGGQVTLNADTSNNKYNNSGTDSVGHETKVFAESFMGRVEAGSTAGAYNAMSVSANNIARATGGAGAGDAQYWTNSARNVDFVTSASFLSDSASGNQQQAAKLTYYSPSYMGLKLGMSYVPDLNQKGSVANTHTVAARTSGSTAGNYGMANGLHFRNVVSGGVSYTGKFSNVGVQAALLAETGEAKKQTNDSNTTRFRKLSSVEGGLKLSYNAFHVAGSYADLGKSGLAKPVNSTSTATSGMKKSNYWTAGVGYEHNNLGASVTYFESKKGAEGYQSGSNWYYRHNKQQNLSVGLDYKLAPGFMPYVEYTNFKQTYGENPALAATANKQNKGHVVLVGTKLQF